MSEIVVPRFSYSKLRTFLGCRYKYDMYYNKNITTRMDAKPPTLGSAGHAGMAAGILGLNVDQALQEWGEEYIKNHPLSNVEVEDDDIDLMGYVKELVSEVVHRASIIVPRALDNLHLEEWETVYHTDGTPLVEMKILMPVMVGGTEVSYIAIIDWVAKHKPTNSTWLIDHKFRKTLQADEAEETNLQLPSYQKVLRMIGVDTIGSISHQIANKIPSIPSVNKNGTMSRAKIATTWDVYEKALLDQGLNPDDYIDEMKPKLDTEFSRMTYLFRNNREVDNTWNDVILMGIRDILGDGSPFLPVRALGSLSCRNCWCKDYCMEELRGGDLEYLLKTQYIIRPPQQDEENETEDDTLDRCGIGLIDT